MSSTMKAVVFHGPGDVRVEDRPVPTLKDATDVIVKVELSGLCGTDLHSYRGHIAGPKDTIIGHEFTGKIVKAGDNVEKFKVGDSVIAVFTVQCGKCYYCRHGYSGNCVETNTFGKIGLDGGQAEYVRVPHADYTLIKKPDSPGDDSVYVLMADIFITGYYGVKKIIDYLNISPAAGAEAVSIKDAHILQLGCGPVGLCGLRVLKYFGFTNVVCVDSVPERLAEAKRLGASKVVNFETESEASAAYVANDLEGIGFDAVLEVVGAPSALRTAYDSVRRNGYISSIGMAHGPLPFEGLECYVKNINISFGRCHAASLFAEALEIFEKLKPDFADFVDYKVKGLDGAAEAFDKFDKHQIQKCVFDLTGN
ncbi:hypothetical protein DIURU_002891 [Diutina rugosa]|uniref:Enoyl reductase (ER) domain-containing protein n=1 Tax=Diutina rugosa TaxID=5481 RepID=A0A642UT92_DIURU|nr:uncharacterized protein DIURU_002891 [Diutina rugosa]KAA8902437.1 hypothetical protein DIURU_002891 [Diutina rugosa]